MRLILSLPLVLIVASCVPILSLGLEHVFYRGAPLVGGNNGLYFDADNNLYVAQVLGQKISKLHPETGQVLDEISNGVGFVDDLAISPDGSTIYWTEPVLGTIMSKPLAGGPAVALYPFNTYPNANPVTLSDDGRLVFFGQCWDTTNTNGIFQLDLVTNITTTIVDGIYGCAANGMDYHDGALYVPRPFEGRIVQINITDGLESVITDWEGTPNAVKLDASQEFLYAINSAKGQVARIKMNDTDRNLEVIAQLPLGWVDNLALDKDNRIYVSSYTEAAIWEVLSPGMNVSENFRIVSPGGVSIPMGMALLNDKRLFTVQPFAVYEIDLNGELVNVFRSIPIIGVLHDPTSIASWDNDLVLMSLLTGELAVWDPVDQSNVLVTEFAGPMDAHPFRGDLLVTELVTGRVVRASGPDLALRQVLLNQTGVRFLGGDNDNVFVSVSSEDGTGSVIQIIANGEILDSPLTVSSGHMDPEGIALSPNGQELVVVTNAGDSGALEIIDLATSQVRTVATDLGLFPPFPGVLPFGWANNVVVSQDGTIYVNSDQANVIYKFSNELESMDQDGTAQTMETSFAANALCHSMLGLLMYAGVVLLFC